MKKSGYERGEDLYYSTIFGNGVYRLTGTVVRDPFGVDQETQAPVLENIFSGEMFFYRRIYLDNPALLPYYERRIMSCPDRTTIFWPSDLLRVPAYHSRDCNLFVDNQYTARKLPPQERQGDLGVLFPCFALHRAINTVQIIRELRNERKLDWKNDSVRTLVIKFARAFDRLNRNGLIYNDVHFSRLYLVDEKEIYFDYSNLAFSREDLKLSETIPDWLKTDSNYPIEFADPAVVQGIAAAPDFRSQNYSMCAMFFYMLFGQFPYDGRLLDGYIDNSNNTHYVKFRDYHKMPVFIFDPSDPSNELGAFDEEAEIIALWEEADPKLKALFISVLSEDNATRKTRGSNPSALDWLKCFQSIGW